MAAHTEKPTKAAADRGQFFSWNSKSRNGYLLAWLSTSKEPRPLLSLLPCTFHAEFALCSLFSCGLEMTTGDAENTLLPGRQEQRRDEAVMLSFLSSENKSFPRWSSG